MDEKKVRELQSILESKIREANQFNNRLNEFSRKSEKDDEEIRFLREEIEKERRKSTADENTIKKLEYILAEKMRLLQDKDARNSNLENDIE